MTIIDEAMVQLADEFVQSIHQWIDSVQGDCIHQIEAARFVERARLTRPDDFRAFLDAHAVSIVTRMMSEHVRHQRATAFQREKHRVFGDVSEAVLAGDIDLGEARGLMGLRYVVSANGTRRTLGQMSHDDCGFVAANYEQAAKTTQIEAAFFRALERRLPADGSRLVADLFTEPQLKSLRLRII